jgi:hypothetical protein
MAREHSACLEASRATALAAHSAASLAAAAGLREAARLLRSCEALARAATAALQSSTPPAVPAASAAPAAEQPKKKKNKKKKGAVSLPGAMVDFVAEEVVPAAAEPSTVAFQLSPHAPAFAPGAAITSGRVLEKKSSRERSPRRAASPGLSSASTSSFSATTLAGHATGGDGFSVGQAALLSDLVSRPDLSGSSVTLRSFDGVSSRWAVSLDTTGESIRVKAHNLKPSIFKPGGLAAGGAG